MRHSPRSARREHFRPERSVHPRMCRGRGAALDLFATAAKQALNRRSARDLAPCGSGCGRRCSCLICRASCERAVSGPSTPVPLRTAGVVVTTAARRGTALPNDAGPGARTAPERCSYGCQGSDSRRCWQTSDGPLELEGRLLSGRAMSRSGVGAAGRQIVRRTAVVACWHFGGQTRRSDHQRSTRGRCR